MTTTEPRISDKAALAWWDTAGQADHWCCQEQCLDLRTLDDIRAAMRIERQVLGDLERHIRDFCGDHYPCDWQHGTLGSVRTDRERDVAATARRILDAGLGPR